MSDELEDPALEAANQKHAAIAAAIWNHVSQWLEVYWWTPLALLSIIGAAAYARLLTGRPPQANADFLVDYASRVVLCILVIVFTSVTRQATGVWLTKAEALSNWQLAAVQAAKACFFAALFTYLLSH